MRADNYSNEGKTLVPINLTSKRLAGGAITVVSQPSKRIRTINGIAFRLISSAIPTPKPQQTEINKCTHQPIINAVLAPIKLNFMKLRHVVGSMETCRITIE